MRVSKLDIHRLWVRHVLCRVILVMEVFLVGQKSSRLSITLWTELVKRGHWSKGREKKQLHHVNKKGQTNALLQCSFAKNDCLPFGAESFLRNLFDFYAPSFSWDIYVCFILRCIEQRLDRYLMTIKSRGPILCVTSSETRSYAVKKALNTRRWLVHVVVTWHVSYKITTLLNKCMKIKMLQIWDHPNIFC